MLLNEFLPIIDLQSSLRVFHSLTNSCFSKYSENVVLGNPWYILLTDRLVAVGGFSLYINKI